MSISKALGWVVKQLFVAYKTWIFTLMVFAMSPRLHMVAFVHERQGESNMARDTGSIVKMSRREGYALHPKAHKALVKRTATPGQQSTGRGFRAKTSQYSLQLREKQKVKRLYGLLEKQFSNLMKEAARREGQSGEMLLQ